VTEGTGDRDRLSPALRWLVLLMGALVPLAVVGGLVVPLLVAGGGDERSALADRHPLAVAVVASLAALVVGAGMAAGFVWYLRRPAVRRLSRYGGPERRETGRAVRAGRPLSPRQGEMAAAQLEYLRLSGWICWLQLLVVAIFLVDGLTHHDTLARLLLAEAVLLAVLVPVTWWMRRRTMARYRAALARPGPADPAA
jgi:hypothetical protein